MTYRYCIIFDIFITYDDHIRYLHSYCFPYLISELFGTVIGFGTEAGGFKLFDDITGVFCGTVCNRKYLDLYGSDPQRECTCEMLCDDTDKTLYGTEYNTVYHYRAVLLTVCSDIFKFKSFGQLHIELYCTALPCSSQRIRQMEVKLRAVESSVALVYHIALTHVFTCSL